MYTLLEMEFMKGAEPFGLSVARTCGVRPRELLSFSFFLYVSVCCSAMLSPRRGGVSAISCLYRCDVSLLMLKTE